MAPQHVQSDSRSLLAGSANFASAFSYSGNRPAGAGTFLPSTMDRSVSAFATALPLAWLLVITSVSWVSAALAISFVCFSNDDHSREDLTGLTPSELM